MRKRSISFALLVTMVFFAGVASLLYEVLWVRQLGLAMGSTVIATSTMLSAFLGGLALGSWIMGKRADVVKNPFIALGTLEVIAAFLGVLSIPALKYAGHLYILIATSFGGTGAVTAALRIIFAAIVMLVPAMVFGMTFPLATKAGSRLIRGEKAAGIVSAASSFGSAAGAALCGLYLEPTFGIFRSALVGAGFNLAAALCVFVVVVMIKKDAAKRTEKK